MMPAMAMTAFAMEGTGTKDNPYEIGTLDELKALATAVNGGADKSGEYYKLTADIGDATTPFTTPIGNKDKPFKGNFDGDGHTVTLGIKGSSYLGLFGCLNGGSIKNVTTAGTVANTSTAITGNGPAAGVCANNIGGTIEKCVNKAAVSCSNYGKYTGGICGKNEGGTINGCSNTAQVKAWGNSAQYFGGICGQNYTGSIFNCANTGEVKALEWAINSMGGICGLNGGVDDAMTADAIIANCVNNGKVTVQGYKNGASEIGGICGRNNAGTNYKSMILNCFSTAVMSYPISDKTPKPSISYCGGVVGYNWEKVDNSKAVVSNCYYDTTVTNTLKNTLTSQAVGSTNFQHVTDTLGMTTAQMKTAAGSTYTGEGRVSDGKALVDLLNGYKDGERYPEGWKEWVVKNGGYPRFEKESRPAVTVTVTMKDYTYGGTPSTPSLSEDIKDGAEVTYYYSTTNSTTDGIEWKDITGTTLNAGNYYMYAVIGETDKYEDYTTTATAFNVAKAEQTAPAPGEGYMIDKKTLKIGIFAGFEVSENDDFTTTIPSGTALENGTTYYIRKAENNNYKASSAISFVANKTFSITYKDEGDVEFTGQHVAGYPTEHTYGTATALKSPTKTGYTFGGWFTDKECTGSAVTSLGAEDYSDDITLYAKWTANTYTVKFDANEGIGSMDSQNFSYDETKSLTANSFTRAGYDFLGWYTEKDAPIAIYTDEQEVSNLTAENNKVITLYAIWKEKDAVAITYQSADVNKGTVSPASEALNPETGKSQGSIAIPAAGYKFVKWTNASGDQVGTDAKYVPEKVEDRNVAATYTANFEAKTYNINYKDQGDAAFSGTHEDGHPTSHTFDADTTLKGATKTGYTFGGWFTNKECTGDAVTNIGAKTYSDDITLYAKWTANTYDVTFVGNFEGSEYSEKMTETYDLHYVLPQKNPVRPNHSFAGWFTEAEGGDQVTADSVVQITGDTTLYAHWTAYNIVPVELLTAKTSGSKAVKLSWNSVPGATKYVVYGQRCGKKVKKLKTTTGNTYTVKKISGKKLKAHKNYKFYVVAYTANGTIQSNIVHFITGNRSGKYANVKSIKAKASTVTLSPGATKKIGATYKMYYGKKHIKKSHGAALRYISNCPSVATVSSSGVVTAKAAGTAIIYIQDIGGKYCKTTVTVK